MNKRPLSKYKQGDKIIFNKKSLKIGKVVWNKEYKEYEYFIYPNINPIFEHEIFYATLMLCE